MLEFSSRLYSFERVVMYIVTPYIISIKYQLV